MTGREEQLQVLRRALYRPDPPVGARERYEALRAELGEQAPVGAAPVWTAPLDAAPALLAEASPAEDEDEDGDAVAAPAPVSGTSRRRRAAAAGFAVLAAAVVVGAGLLWPGRGGSAERLDPALGRQDGARLAAALAPSGPPWGPSSAGATVVDVLQRSHLPQLAVWDGREALGWVQRGSGPLHREFGAGRTGRSSPEPLSIVVRCAADAVYLWTIRGTAPGSDDVRVLASGDADRCDRATVTTASLPAGSRITSFDLRVPRGIGWTMAVVVPEYG